MNAGPFYNQCVMKDLMVGLIMAEREGYNGVTWSIDGMNPHSPVGASPPLNLTSEPR